MKLHLAFLSAFASLAAAAVAGNSQAPPFTEEPGGVEKRNHFEDLLPAEVDDPRPEAHDFSKGCDRPCEEVKKWSKLSMDEHLAHSPSAPPGKRDDVKDSTFPKNERSYSAACSRKCEKDLDCCLWDTCFKVDYWSQISIDENIVRRLLHSSAPPEKRDDIEGFPILAFKPHKPEGQLFSRVCRRPCEIDSHCCGSDTCSSNQRCEGLYDERFPKGYPLGQELDWSNDTDVDYWSKLSMEQDKAHGLDNPSTPPEKRDDVKDPTLSEKPLVSVADSRKTFIPTPDDFPPDFRPVVKWSPDCRKTCEKDDDCCR
ncbi:hypothetical protein AARAC_000553 [Aspergillus arachidicola]|uniref:Uncharacterized protein n=1 Tax=Aspergillus arachidicola TaxID=656916 RepID=A0A2G7G746_9EURO|nr:hypothetical protein AARAC_000553 [Aspergillus arachidicola]